MSVVVKDLSKGDNYFMLYCKGDDESMQNTLKFLPEEKNNFKRLNLKFRSNGLKTMVFARKELTESNTKAYVKNFSLIQSQRKDKQKSFDLLAIDLEQKLEFLGILGYKDKLRDGAE